MAATSKELFQLFNSSGQLVSGRTITGRAVGGIVDLFTFAEPDNVNYPGYYTLIADTGLYDLYINAVKQTAFSPWLHIDSATLPLPVTSNTNLFGDSSDGSYTLDGAQAAVANLFSKNGNVYTLLRDAFFLNLTVNVNITLQTAGFRLFVSGTNTNNGTISNLGTVGVNGGNAAGTTAGTAATAVGSAPGAYLAGNVASSDLTGVGGIGGTVGNNGAAGVAGSVLSNCIGSNGQNGVAGGAGGGVTGVVGTGGAGGVASYTLMSVNNGGMRNLLNGLYNRAFSSSAAISPKLHGMNAGSGGGGGGASGANTFGDSMTGHLYPGKPGGGTITYGVTGAIGNDSDKAISTDGSGSSNAQRPVVITLVTGWTIEGWLKSNNLAQNGIGIYNGNGSADGYGFGHNTSAKIQVLFGGVAVRTGTFTFPDTTSWHYIVLTRSGSTTSLYVDGALDSTFSDTPGTPTGSFRAGGSSSNNWNGSIDEVAMYNTAITLTQVQNHYAARNNTPVYSTTIIADSPTFYWRLSDTGTGNGGAGGGGATPGGNGGIIVMANAILVGNGTVTVAGAVGGNGGNGGDPTLSGAGGGGGGAGNGGQGGWAIHLYRSKTGWTGTFNVSGGSPGNPGTGGGQSSLATGANGASGNPGVNGLLEEYTV